MPEVLGHTVVAPPASTTISTSPSRSFFFVSILSLISTSVTYLVIFRGIDSRCFCFSSGEDHPSFGSISPTCFSQPILQLSSQPWILPCRRNAKSILHVSLMPAWYFHRHNSIDVSKQLPHVVNVILHSFIMGRTTAGIGRIEKQLEVSFLGFDLPGSIAGTPVNDPTMSVTSDP